MKYRCDFAPSPAIKNLYECRHCKLRTYTPVKRKCANQSTARRPSRHLNPLYLGDRVERWLSKVGITPARIIAAKKLIGLKPKCGCQWRKDLLNRFDRWVRRQFA